MAARPRLLRLLHTTPLNRDSRPRLRPHDSPLTLLNFPSRPSERYQRHIRTCTSNPPARDPATAAMSSDADYEAFLNKASADSNNSGANTASTSSKKTNFRATKATTAPVPASLKSIDATLTSDADEPFEPVSLEYKDSAGELPDAKEFAGLIGHEHAEDQVEKIGVKDFDPRNEYGVVVEAVKKESKGGEVVVYRVEHKGHGGRVEYFVVGLGEKGRIVGLKALSVES